MGNGWQMCNMLFGMCNMLFQILPEHRKNTGFYAGCEPASPSWEPRYPEKLKNCAPGRRRPGGMREASIRNYGVSGIAFGRFNTASGHRGRAVFRCSAHPAGPSELRFLVLGFWVWESLLLVGWLLVGWLVGWLSVVGWLLVGC